MAELSQDDLDKEFNDAQKAAGLSAQGLSQEDMDKEFELTQKAKSSTPPPISSPPPASPTPVSPPASSSGWTPPPDEFGRTPEQAEGGSQFVTDLATSTGSSIPFATRGLSATEALVDALRGNGYNYSDWYKYNQDYLDKRRDAYPTYNMNIAGMDVPINGYDAMGAVGSSLLPIGVAGKVLGKGVEAAEVGAKMLPQVWKGIAGGGLAGSVYGLSSSPDLGDLGSDALHIGLGALIGGGTGGLGAAAAVGLGKLGTKYAEKNNPSNLEGFSPAASKEIYTGLQNGRPQMSPNLPQDMAQLGPLGTPGDLNASTRAQIKTLAQQQPGNHLDQLQQTYENRSPNSAIQSALDDPTNGVPPWNKTQAQVAQKLQTDRQAYNQKTFGPLIQNAGPVPEHPVNGIIDNLDTAIENTAKGSDRYDALNNIRTALVKNEATPPTADNPGSPRVPVTNPQVLHDVKDMIYDEYSKGNYSPALKSAKDDISDTLSSSIPGYDKAMRKYNLWYRQGDALEKGAEQFLSPDTTYKDFTDQWNGLKTKGEKNAAIMGMTDYIRKNFAKKANDPSAMNTLLQGMDQTGDNYKIISHVFGPNVADNLSQSMRSAAKLTAGNSAWKAGEIGLGDQTGSQLEDTLRKMENSEPYFTGEMSHPMSMYGHAFAAGRGVANSLISALKSSKNPGTLAQEMTNFHTSQGPIAQAYIADALRKAPLMQQNAQYGNNVGNIISRSLGMGVLPLEIMLSQNRGQ